MSIFDYNVINLGYQTLPPDKRYPLQKSWVGAQVGPLQYLVNLIFGMYRLGSDSPPFNYAITYVRSTRVIYKYSVYESLWDNNTGHEPLDTFWWRKVQDNFVGVDERLAYNGHTLVLTYALNKYFGTQFRQPNGVSDIYLINNVKPVAPFIVGYSEGESSKVGLTTSSEFITNEYGFDAFQNMTVMVPTAVYEALDPDPNNNERIIRNFVDQYIVAGVTYNVATY